MPVARVHALATAVLCTLAAFSCALGLGSATRPSSSSAQAALEQAMGWDGDPSLIHAVNLLAHKSPIVCEINITDIEVEVDGDGVVTEGPCGQDDVSLASSRLITQSFPSTSLFLWCLRVSNHTVLPDVVEVWVDRLAAASVNTLFWLRGPCEYVHIVGDVIARHAAAALTPLSRTAVIIAQAGSSCPPFLPPSPAVTLAHTPAWSVACVGPMCGSIGPLVLAGPPPPPPLVQADPPPLPSCEPLSSRIRTLHAQLEGAQRPSDCSTARLLVFDYGSEAALHGFSAMFQFLASSLLVARASGRVLVEISSAGAEQDVWPRAPLGPCAGKLLACYFEPLSSCEFVSQAPGHLASLPFLQWGNMAEQSDRIVRMPGLSVAGTVSQLMALTAPAAVPAWFTCGHSDHWRSWFPAVEAFLFRPLPAVVPPMLQGVAQALREGGVSTTEGFVRLMSVGIHIRHGDVSTLAYRIPRPVSDYARVASALAFSTCAAGRLPLIHVATDNITARGELAAATAPVAVTLPYAPSVLVSARPVHLETVLSSMPESSGYSLTVGVIQDIYLLSSCSYLLGSCMSQVSRLAAELAHASGIAASGPVAFDVHTCRSFPTHFYTIPLDWRSEFDCWAV